MAKIRPLAIVSIVGLILSLISPLPVYAGSTITITASGTDTNPVGNQSGTDRHMAQSFTVGSGGVLTQITIRFAANVGSPSSTATWFIDSDSGGFPGPNIASGTFTPTASATNTLNINSVQLVNGGKYWLRLQSTSAQSSGNYWQWGGQNTSTYAYGIAAQQNGSGAWSASTGSGAVDLECSVTLTDATALPTSTPPNTPVPTATEKPDPTGIPTSTPYIFVPVPTATEKPDPTVVPDDDVPTATEKPNPTGIPTSTPMNTPVDTPTEINTPVDTPTEINTPVDTPTTVSCSCTGGGDTATPTITLTPTDTLTPSITPTPTDTATPTPDLYSLTTLEPGGQAGGIIYLISAGEAAIFAVLAFIITILLILLFLGLRSRA